MAADTSAPSSARAVRRIERTVLLGRVFALAMLAVLLFGLFVWPRKVDVAASFVVSVWLAMLALVAIVDTILVPLGDESIRWELDLPIPGWLRPSLGRAMIIAVVVGIPVGRLIWH